MPILTSPAFYTVINESGEILYSRITDNPEYPVQIGNRLVLDQLPPHDPSEQRCVRITPVPDGQSFVEYQITELYDTIELKAAVARSRRDQELKDSDLTQLLDAPLSTEQRAAWATYRQALREIPQQASFPNTIVWPDKPE